MLKELQIGSRIVPVSTHLLSCHIVSVEKEQPTRTFKDETGQVYRVEGNGPPTGRMRMRLYAEESQNFSEVTLELSGRAIQEIVEASGAHGLGGPIQCALSFSQAPENAPSRGRLGLPSATIQS